MKSCTFPALFVLVSFLVVPAHAQTAQPDSGLTAAAIVEAIKLGESSKDRRNPGFYRLQDHGALGDGPVLGVYSTPFSRIVAAAYEAKRKYVSFSPADVTPEMMAPELWVYAFSHVQARTSSRVLDVEAVVVLPHESQDRAQAIQPTRIETLNDTYKNLLGATLQGKGLLAVFPIAVLSDANDLHVIFDGVASGNSIFKGCKDCAVQFKTAKVR